MNKYFILILLLCSCSALNYNTMMQNIPLLDKKGEITVLCGRDNNNNLGIQFSSSLEDHFAIQYSSLLKSKRQDRFYEGGLGYYNKIEDIWAVETFVGYGKWIKNDILNNKNYKFDFDRYYIQPSCGITTKYIDIALTYKLSRLTYNVTTDSFFDKNDKNYSEEQLLFNSANLKYLIMEPGFTFRIGYKYFKLQYQYFSAVGFGVTKNNTNSISMFIKIPLIP